MVLDIGPAQEKSDMSRFFVEPRDVAGDRIFIHDKGDIHHITKVLRLKPGSHVDISDSREWEYKGRIISLSQDAAEVKILDKQKFAREPRLKITLFQGIPKQGKMEGIIQKSVELGVCEIVPVFMARTIACDKGNFGKKADRWQKVSDEAVKQCKRGIVPRVAGAISFSGMIELLTPGSEGFDLVLFPYENENARTIKQALRGLSAAPGSLAVIIGPEGGFSDEEAESLKEAGAICVSLGKTILRTETAGPAALAMAMYELEL